MLILSLAWIFSLVTLSRASLSSSISDALPSSSNHKEQASSFALSTPNPVVRLALPDQNSQLSHSLHITRQVSASCRRPGKVLCSRNFSSDFCCDKATTCKILAGTTTALCCPDGKCDMIMPVTCDINWLDVEKYPDSSVVTTALDYELPTCGKSGSGTPTCCPFGYSCSQDGTVCMLDKDQRSLRAERNKAYFALTQPGSNSSSTHPTTSATSPESADKSRPTVAESAPTQQTEAQGQPISDKSTTSATVGVAVGSTLAAVALIGILLSVTLLKRSRIARAVARFKQRRTQEKHSRPRRFLPSWIRQKPSVDFYNVGMPTPPPPAYVPYHLDLDKCRRVPRRKTVPPSRRDPAPVMQQFSPVELPASPVSLSFWRSSRVSRRSNLVERARMGSLRPPPGQPPPQWGSQGPEYPAFF